MISDSDITNCLAGYVDSGIKKFAIYPYGDNGRKVKRILEEHFGICLCAIADNILSKYREDILNFDELKQLAESDLDMHVILTIENDKLNGQLEHGLKKIISKERIVNLMQKNFSKENEKEAYSRFALKNIIPEFTNRKKGETTKIKVRILNYSRATWNAIRTICIAFQKDELFDCLVLLGKGFKSEEALNDIKEQGLKSIPLEEYEVKNDLPDIFIVNHPYDTFSQIEDCRKYCKLIVVTSMQLVRYSYTWKGFWNIQRIGFERFQPDYYLFDSLLYREIMDSEYANPCIVEMGNAKFDGIYEACQNEKLPSEWGKLDGKKKILWTTDHGVHDGRVTDDVTFDLYGQAVFRYAKENPNVGIIFRPHPTLIGELLKENIWSERDLQLLKEYCEQSVNIIFDDTLTYERAYACADGIIADAFCGISCSALPTLKPICLTYRNKDDVPYHEDLASCYYSAHNADELISFMDIIKNDKDTMMEARKSAVQKYIKHFDGKNGYRIKTFIKQKYLEL